MKALKSRFKAVGEEERVGLTQITMKDQDTSSFKELLGQKRSGTLACSQEDQEEVLKQKY